MVQQFQYSRPKGIVDSEPPSEDDASDTSEKIMHHKKVAFSMPHPSPTATRMHHHEPREPVKRVRRPLSLLGSFKRIVCCHWCTDDRVTPYSETADDDMVTEAEAARLLGRRAKQLEMITYFVFAVIFGVVALGNLPTTSDLWHQQQVRDTLLRKEMQWSNSEFGATFNELLLMREVWLWLDDVLLGTVLGSPRSDAFAGDNAHTVLQSSIVIGNHVRLKQMRVRPTVCRKQPAKLQALTQVCWPAYSEATESREAFGVDRVFQWQQLPAQAAVAYTADLSVYAPQGFVYDLGPNLTEARKSLRFLRDSAWLDIATRALLVELALYDAPSRLVLWIRLSFEFAPTGGVVKQYHGTQLRLAAAGTEVTALRGVEYLLVFCIACSFLRHVWLMYSRGVRRQLGDAWNILDLCNIGLLCFAVITRVIRMRALEGVTITAGAYTDFAKAAAFADSEARILAFSAALTLGGLAKYFEAAPIALGRIYRALQRTSAELGGFALMFVAYFWAFACAFHLVFGHHLSNYRDLATACMSLMQILAGRHYDFVELYDVNPVLGPILFTAFSAIANFVILNLFVAVLIMSFTAESIEEAKADEARMRAHTQPEDSCMDPDDDYAWVNSEQSADRLDSGAAALEAMQLGFTGSEAGGTRATNESRAPPISFGHIVAKTDLLHINRTQAAALTDLTQRIAKLSDRSDSLAEYTQAGAQTQRPAAVYKKLQWKLGMLCKAIRGDDAPIHWDSSGV